MLLHLLTPHKQTSINFHFALAQNNGSWSADDLRKKTFFQIINCDFEMI
jgi:hypothetical protein